MSKTKKKIPKSPKQSENDSGDWKEEEYKDSNTENLNNEFKELFMEYDDKFKPTKRSDKYSKSKVLEEAEPFNESLFTSIKQEHYLSLNSYSNHSKIFNIEELPVPKPDEDAQYRYDYEEMLSDKVYTLTDKLINNPSQFVRLIKLKPSLIFNDLVIQRTLGYLQSIINLDESNAFRVDGSSVIKAIKMLEDAGLSAFIPPTAPEHKGIVKNKLYVWKKKPEDFLRLVQEAVNEIKFREELIDRDSLDKIDMLKMFFKKMYYRSCTIPKRLLEKYQHNNIHIAIIFLCERYGVSAESAIDYYKKDFPRDLKKRIRRSRKKSRS